MKMSSTPEIYIWISSKFEIRITNCSNIDISLVIQEQMDILPGPGEHLPCQVELHQHHLYVNFFPGNGFQDL